jgi:chemotaxis protein methyltransferase CheR
MKNDKGFQFCLDQLLDTILFRYGYDFKNYARASLERKVISRMNHSEMTHVSEMIPRVMTDPLFFDLFLRDMSTTVTEMFRDPFVFKKIRELCPILKTYPRINIWHAGCATGEEVYSMAILLEEEGLLGQSQIYATDFNNNSLDIAKKGIYPADSIALFTKNYIESGGKSSFADYYQAKYDNAKMKGFLKKHITFANHNLVHDKVFAEMHLILCRNVLIYFNETLQGRVLDLFNESMIHRGLLVLGDKETLEFTSINNQYEVCGKRERIYRKILND